MPLETPHILIVDDDTRLRDLLQKYLFENGFRVSTAQDAEEARAKLSSLAFDFLIIDVMMPGETGLELTASLRSDSNVPILLLTARGNVDDRILGLECGADDYLTKPFEPKELVLRINAILRRTPDEGVAPKTVRFGDYLFDVERKELFNKDALLRLTQAETSLLTILAVNAGVPISREELCRKADIQGNPRTVDVQITRLRRKIEIDPRAPHYLQTIRGKGYLLRND